jgi:hypothetical protein
MIMQGFFIWSIFFAIDFYHDSLIKMTDRPDVQSQRSAKIHPQIEQRYSQTTIDNKSCQGNGAVSGPHRLGFCGGLFCPSLPTRGALFGSSGFCSSATTARSRGDRRYRGKPSQGH